MGDRGQVISETTIGYFELIATYYAELYFNTLYNSVMESYKKSKDKNMSFENLYKVSVLHFTKQISENPDNASKQFKNLYEYIKTVVPQTLNEFCLVFCCLFFPEQFHGEFRKNDICNRCIRRIMETITKKTGIALIQDFLKNLVNEKTRKNKEITNSIQIRFNEILLDIKSDFYTESVTKTSSRGHVNEELYIKQREISTKALNQIDKLKDDLAYYKNKTRNFKDDYKKMQTVEAENIILKKEILILRAQVEGLQRMMPNIQGNNITKEQSKETNINSLLISNEINNDDDDDDDFIKPTFDDIKRRRGDKK